MPQVLSHATGNQRESKTRLVNGAHDFKFTCFRQLTYQYLILTILNVIPHDIDHIITVRSVVFMEVTDCVTELVENKPYILTAVAHVKDLFSSNGAHH